MASPHRDHLAELLAHPPVPVDRALEFLDALPPVTVDELRGRWRGRELPTGHPLDGLLAATGWHGKLFDDPEHTHPLVMAGRRGLFHLNPALVPLRAVLRFGNRPMARLARPLLPLLATRRPAARLRMVEYRGVPTATMIYDALPVLDHFRRVDDRTLLGVMDLRDAAPFFFVLEREPVSG